MNILNETQIRFTPVQSILNDSLRIVTSLISISDPWAFGMMMTYWPVQRNDGKRSSAGGWRCQLHGVDLGVDWGTGSEGQDADLHSRCSYNCPYNYTKEIIKTVGKLKVFYELKKVCCCISCRLPVLISVRVDWHSVCWCGGVDWGTSTHTGQLGSTIWGASSRSGHCVCKGPGIWLNRSWCNTHMRIVLQLT